MTTPPPRSHGLLADWPQLARPDRLGDIGRPPPDAPHARRRQALRLLGGAGLMGSLPLLGCGGGGAPDDAGGSATPAGSCSAIPAETAGPYPADGTNSNGAGLVNLLTLADIVRSDIRSSIGGATGTAAGVPLSVRLTLVDTNASCAPLAGHAVYLWHCNRAGQYSMYSAGVTDQNYLRGVQVSDAAGQLVFQSIFPGCYSGRWPHLHFEVFRSLASATSGANDLRTSQLALPQAVCQQVYGTAEGYGASVANLAAISLGSDNVFGNDSAALQMATLVGNLVDGFTASLVVGVAA